MTLATTDSSWFSANWGTLALIAGGIVLLLVVDQVMARTGRRWTERLPSDSRAMLETRYRLLRRVVMATLIFLVVVIVLFNIPATQAAAKAALASSAVLGLAVGFAARTTLANFVAGVMIAINQPVRIGDRVQIADAEGTVEDIGLTYTRLRTPDNRRVLIPNEELAGGRVVNLTLIDPVTLASVRVAVPLSADPLRVSEVLAELVPVAPGRTPDRPDPGVAVAELNETTAVFTVGVWTIDPLQGAATSAWLRERCLTRLADEGIFSEVTAEAVK
jgi:small-conductance mechanosensitive channel